MAKPAPTQMEKIVSLCKRRGFLFQSSEIYGGINGFWDYGPLGVELKRNIRDAWWKEMVSRHTSLSPLPGALSSFDMVGLETSIVMHPQVWKCSGHFDLFHDFMVDDKETKARYRIDHLHVVIAFTADDEPLGCETFLYSEDGSGQKQAEKRLKKAFRDQIARTERTTLNRYYTQLAEWNNENEALHPRSPEGNRLTDPREFNLMFKTFVGALSGEEGAAYLRPETAQGMFVNFKNVVDSSRVKLPFGIAQIGKSFRNEITPRNFTFRSREFEQMEIEFFCRPEESMDWYTFWRDRRLQWYKDLGLNAEKIILREHDEAELAHYSKATADIEYAFPFLPAGEYGELEGIAHRGDFDLHSHSEGKLAAQTDGSLRPELDENGQPKHRGSGKDLSYFDDESRERFLPHVIEPSAGADRAALAFLCDAYDEDVQPDEKGNEQSRTLLRLHPKLAPVKAAVFPLIKKGPMKETAVRVYQKFKEADIAVVYDQQGAIGRRYRRQDEIGTPFCLTVDGETETDDCLTIRDRDSLAQERISIDRIVEELQARLR